jgi:hypothetical protein
MILIAFNTTKQPLYNATGCLRLAIFIGSALIQKAFQIDILPIVCSMTGATRMTYFT